MGLPVDPVARNQFLRVTSDPLRFIEQWMLKLETWNNNTLKMADVGEDGKYKVAFRAGFVTRTFFALSSMRYKLERHATCSHRELLVFVHGMNFAKFWSVDFKSSSPVQLWEAVTSGLYDASGRSKTPAGNIVTYSTSYVRTARIVTLACAHDASNRGVGVAKR